MPFSASDFAVPIGDQHGQAIITIESGNLYAAAIHTIALSFAPIDCFAQLFLISTELPQPLIIAQLASNYLTNDFPIAWDGSIPMYPTYAVMARIYTLTVSSVRLLTYSSGAL